MKLELLFPIHLRDALHKLEELNGLEEIRVRVGQPLFFLTALEELVLDKANGQIRRCQMCQNAYRITEADMVEILNYISNYSLYAWQEEIRNGYLTICGGHRIGLCGSTKNCGDRIDGISYLTFLNIRVAHERRGCADEILKYIRREKDDVYHTLIIAAPGVGKTTFLRDCIRSLSYGEGRFPGKKMGVIDERSEIAACYHGIPQNDIGPRTDVLDGCKKTEGMKMLLRSMSPEILAVDELLTQSELDVVEEAAYCGCRIIGTVHARDLSEFKEKLELTKWSQCRLFERFVVIEKEGNGERCVRVYNQQWEQLY